MSQHNNIKYAVDSSSFNALLKREIFGNDTDLLSYLLIKNELMMPPIVVSEMLSSKHLTPLQRNLVLSIPLLRVKEGFCFFFGDTRRIISSKGLKARIPDTMVAQFCLDNNMTLITRDDDFVHYRNHMDMQMIEIKS